MASGVFVVAFGLAVWSEEVAALGIELLDPIVRHPPPRPMAGGVAGPDAARRVGCAAVATLADAARGGRGTSCPEFTSERPILPLTGLGFAI